MHLEGLRHSRMSEHAESFAIDFLFESTNNFQFEADSTTGHKLIMDVAQRALRTAHRTCGPYTWVPPSQDNSWTQITSQDCVCYIL